MKHSPIWTVAILAFGVGCDVPVLPITAVYGNWRADYSFGWQVLQLRTDGTYEQTVTINGKSGNVKHSGKWHYDTKLGNVGYQDCLLVIDGFGNVRNDFATPVDGACVTPVERRFLFVGGVRMGSEEGSLFIKQP